MKVKLSHSRMDAIQSPIIPVIGQLIRDSLGTISLGQGVVHYQPPASAIEMLPKFLSEPSNNLYKDVLGIPELIKALSSKLSNFNNIEVSEENDNSIVVTAGSNMGFMNAIMSITSPGDEIILNTPYYFNHEMAIQMAGCHAVLVPTTDAYYQLDPIAIAAAITDKTRAIVTISPNNPTGVVYSEDVLRQVNELCRQHGIYHISDEAYEYFTYDGIKHISPGSFKYTSISSAKSDDSSTDNVSTSGFSSKHGISNNQHTISLYSLSKAYGFASWRIGYMVVPRYLLTSIKKAQDTILICPPVISQYAALGALQAQNHDVYLTENIESISQVRELVKSALQPLIDQELCTINFSQGAFYFFIKINISHLTNICPASSATTDSSTVVEFTSPKTQLDLELVKRLIQEFKVAVIPGSAFGTGDSTSSSDNSKNDDGSCYLRVAYGALEKDTVKEGIDRLVKGLLAILS